MCDICHSVHQQIKRYLSDHEEGRQFTLTKFDVFANVVFPLAWHQRQCLCCFKETKNYEALNNITQMMLVISIRLLKSYGNENKLVTTGSDDINTEEESDRPADEAKWTYLELEQLLGFISNSLLMSFPLYIVCKHNHICGVEELSQQETNILASYCDVSEAELLPVFLLRNVAFFCDCGGPGAILKCLEDFPEKITMPVLLGLVSILANLRLWLSHNAIEQYLFPLKPTLVRFMCNLTDDELRQAGNRNITEMVLAVLKQPTGTGACLFDEDYLKLAFKYFNCSTLTIRMAGLQHLNGQVACFSEAMNSDPIEAEPSGSLLADWLVSNKIIEHIFGPNLHNELVKQSQVVLNFLAAEGRITNEHIDIMWHAALLKHCARQVQDVLILMVKPLLLPPLVHLMDRLAALEPQAHTEQTLLLISTITKVLWSVSSNEPHRQLTVPGKNSQGDTSFENEISICSTDEESEETSDSEMEIPRPKRALPSIPNDPILLRRPTANPVIAVQQYPFGGGAGPRTSGSSESEDESILLRRAHRLSNPRPSPTRGLVPQHDRINVNIGNQGSSFTSNPPRHLSTERPVAVTAMDTSDGEVFHPGSDSNSQLSARSEKNMADFEGEDGFASEDELAQIHSLSKNRDANLFICTPGVAEQGARFPVSPSSSVDTTNTVGVKYIDLEKVCDPGHTLLWDLVQDNMVHLLPEGLASEAEKLLTTLLCSFPDSSRRIRLKFIEASVLNIANNRSETVSLKLLPKIISSFDQVFRAQRGVDDITMSVNSKLDMMEVFFKNLIHFRQQLNEHGAKAASLHGLKTDISVRLHFLSFVYSFLASPEDFCLSHEQIDILWDCLAMHKETCDHIHSWIIQHIRSREFHAMSLSTFKYIYTDKLTQVNLKNLTMTGFNLFRLLHEILQQTDSQSEDEDQQLWDVALKCQSGEVSVAAIDYLNGCYMSGNELAREPEFIDRCMNCVMMALTQLTDDLEISLQVIKRGLYLLKNHIDNFRARFSCQLKMLQLRGTGVTSHQSPPIDKQAQTLVITLSAPTLKNHELPTTSCKKSVEVLSSLLLGELRAEVTHWWQTLLTQQKESGMTQASHQEILNASVRLITNGQEMGTDHDMKTLGQLHFKDGQVVLVSMASARQKMKQESSHSALDLAYIPMVILAQQPHFNNLFTILESLNSFQKTLKPGEGPQLTGGRAKSLARRVWDLLMCLPTNEQMLQAMQESDKDEQTDWAQLLDATKPPRLMYSLQIIEALSKTNKSIHRKASAVSGDSTHSSGDAQPRIKKDSWSKKFITEGGLLHLFTIFTSRELQASSSEEWNEWSQDCLAHLLRLLNQFAILPLDNTKIKVEEMPAEPTPENGAKRKLKEETSVIPKLNKMVLHMLQESYDKVFNILKTIIYDAARCPVTPMPVWGRLEVMHYAMLFLVNWAYSDLSIKGSLCDQPDFHGWLKRLTLEAPEAQLRQEACNSLYKLCLGQSDSKCVGQQYLIATLKELMKLLPLASEMRPSMSETSDPGEARKAKHGPSSRDYLWLTGQLLDNLDAESSKQFDLDKLAADLRGFIASRKFYEQRHSTAKDEGLVGLLNLSATLMKHNPTYKTAAEGQMFMTEVFDCLFSLPSITHRHLPKCKSNSSRCAAFDLLVEMVKGSVENYDILLSELMEQHEKHSPYPWDYWPNDDVRSNSGYVGLQNLGATCYMATCMQHLYMIPQARQSVLQAECNQVKAEYQSTLLELKKTFAYLMESERKAFNPQNFCKVYHMDHQPLNTGEQKDMTEFFTDLITKMEEMSPELKELVKDLFGGVLSNNVVSLDCGHVSKTREEFYTIRCQVADMKSLYESLDEVCVKDTLDGDNMYTCSQCQKKVRAEKRACFKRLPKILCFNTMRYTFNMVTMLKEKVNTHFSFPLELKMAGYMEDNLIQVKQTEDEQEKPKDALRSDISKDKQQLSPMTSETGDNEELSTTYELIGVTVHTGTADGGHYYSFIRDRVSRIPGMPDNWYLFNDSEVKPFDPAGIAQECFGGEMTSKTYDTISDKFMDFSFEKTNSAYMLFYERKASPSVDKSRPPSAASSNAEPMEIVKSPSDCGDSLPKFNFDLSEDLADWIWKDNTSFLQDKNIFDHNYFGFMWQMCAYMPTTLPKDRENVSLLQPAQLSASFLLETFIHAKEKPTMVHWIENLTKQFNQCPKACEWFLDVMAADDNWPQQILIKCPNQVIRQMFQRLIIHVLNQLRNKLPALSAKDNQSVIAKFISKQVDLMKVPDIRTGHTKYLSEYFSFLYEFARFGDEEMEFLREIGCISVMASFYLGDPKLLVIVTDREPGAAAPDEDDDDDGLTALDYEERVKAASLEKMIALIAMLVENSRTEDGKLSLSDTDMQSLIGGKGFKFLVNQISDGINPRQTCNLIFSLCRWNNKLASDIINMIFVNIVRTQNMMQCQLFLKILTMVTEMSELPSGHPDFTEFVQEKFWGFCEKKPQQLLEWMSNLVCHDAQAHTWVLRNIHSWVEPYLLASPVPRDRAAAMLLLVSLVPCTAFRMLARQTGHRNTIYEKDISSRMSPEARRVLHEVYGFLLELLPNARKYADVTTYGTSHLMSYFGLLTLCLISNQEKIMFSPYFNDLWQMFQPKLTDPPVSISHNKQALMVFWYHVCVDCPANIKLIISNPTVTRNVAFNYILADHDDPDVVYYNRCMLPAYYGLLRLCCERSRSFVRQLGQHQNIIWAFQHIVPFANQYQAAVEELHHMLKLIVEVHPDSTEEELQAIQHFKKKILTMYQQTLNARSDWQTILTVLKIVLCNEKDRMMYVMMNGLATLAEVFAVIHGMYHEATACHVLTDLCDCLTMIVVLIKVAKQHVDSKEIKSALASWKDRTELIKNCLTLLNSYTPSEVRQKSLDVLREMVMLFGADCIPYIAQLLLEQHAAFQHLDAPSNHNVLHGPYLPTRRQKKSLIHNPKINVRPVQPQFGLFLHHSIVEMQKGQDLVYDQAMSEFYTPYHHFVDVMVRVAVNQKCLDDTLINLSAIVAFEGIPLHQAYFAKLWCEISQAPKTDRKYIKMLLDNSFLIDYMEGVLHDDRSCLANNHIYQFFCTFFKMVHQSILCDESSVEGLPLNPSIVQSLHQTVHLHPEQTPTAVLSGVITKANADLRALMLIYQCQRPGEYDPYVIGTLTMLRTICAEYKDRIQAEVERAKESKPATIHHKPAPKVQDPEIPAKKLKLIGTKRKREPPHVEDKTKTDDGQLTSRVPPEEQLPPPATSPAISDCSSSQSSICSGSDGSRSCDSRSCDSNGRLSDSDKPSDSITGSSRSVNIGASTSASSSLKSNISSESNPDSRLHISRFKKKMELVESVLDGVSKVLDIIGQDPDS